ncbi:hypothetical protein OPV22_019059 [Ensete ventricosum]|uniref:Uncharacterized protein n=1 Tax=Ensete ventricosum TaxID=4639 RepID=A0AAV8R1M6_ENSVE|nr:hypothetical protein OPV22_019059 [Ensete ventricosum]
MMESAKGRSAVEELPGRAAVSPCWKKKAPDAGFLANAKDHLDQFVSTPMDQHRICLKKTMRGVGDYVKLRRQSKEARQAIASSDSASKDGE